MGLYLGIWSRSIVMLEAIPAIVVLVVAVLPVHSQDVFVDVKQGRLRGKIIMVQEKSVESYLGIPFALPPVGERRFKRPLPPANWNGEFDATSVGSVCPQPGLDPQRNLSMSEDCLFINVYTPAISKQPAALPVLLYIHGGAFFLGHGAGFDPSLLTKNDIVTVSFNYRLGVLGFLSMGDESAPGNFGMMDQVMALTWVKDNIAMFGGNPNDVTLMGFSAGSASASLHMVSPLSKGLFHKIILNSGSSMSSWAAAKPDDKISPRDVAMSLAGMVNCSGSDSETVVTCLRIVGVETLFLAGTQVKNSPRRIAWAPVIEKHYGFLPEDPRKVTERGDSANIPTIIGFSKDEWANVVAAKVPDANNGINASTFLNEIQKYAADNYPDNVIQATSALQRVYLESINTNDPTAVRTSYMHMLSDQLFIAPAILESKLLTSRPGQQSVFVYKLNRRPDNMNTPQWRGVTHLVGLYLYIFGVPILDRGQFNWMWNWKWSDSDKALTNDVISMITNFIKNGNPTPTPVNGVSWTRYTPRGQNYLNIDLQSEMRTNFRPDQMYLWAETMPKILEPYTTALTASGHHPRQGYLLPAFILGLVLLTVI